MSPMLDNSWKKQSICLNSESESWPSKLIPLSKNQQYMQGKQNALALHGHATRSDVSTAGRRPQNMG